MVMALLLRNLSSIALLSNKKTLTLTLTLIPNTVPSSPSLPANALLLLLLHCHYLSTKPRNPRSKPRKPPIPPPPDPSQFQQSISQLPPRFTPEDLSKTLALQRDPRLCLQLFHWASHQSRFKHDLSTYLLTIKKLGSAKMYPEMDSVAAQALAVPSVASETLYNTIIYFYTEARMLSRAINVYKRMRDSDSLPFRPTLRTYNLLLAALLSRGTNTYINHVFMETVRSLFRQMVDGGIEPDIFSLNSMIKGYVLSLHVNDALRVFHQMGVAYKCLPNEHSYNHLVHGLCAQGRTENAMELYLEMKGKGFVPSEKAYNSLVNGLAMAGSIDGAVGILWEMVEKRRLVDRITYRTVFDEMLRQGRVEDAMGLLRELQERGFVDGQAYKELLHGIQDNYGDGSDLDDRSGFSRR